MASGDAVSQKSLVFSVACDHSSKLVVAWLLNSMQSMPAMTHAYVCLSTLSEAGYTLVPKN